MNSIREVVLRISLRWAVNSFGLWLAGRLLPKVSFGEDLKPIIVAGLVLSLINALIKPAIVLLSLPAIVVSLGVFMVFINGFMVYLASKLVSEFEITGFGSAMITGIIIGLVNYAITTLLEERLLKNNE